MTLRSLEIFVAVARFGKMSIASEELHISQPTISQAIAELEKEFNVLLFDRLSKKLYITEAGRRLFSYAQGILSLKGEMERNMASLSGIKTVFLGATITVGKCILVDLVREFEEKHPDTKIQVTIDNTVIIEQHILNGQVDIAFVEGKIKSNEIIVQSALSDPMVLVMHPKHPFASREEVSVRELEGMPCVLREPGSGTREIFIDQIKQFGVEVDIKWNCHGYDSILDAVMANQGLTVISKRLAQPYIESGALGVVSIKEVSFERNFSLAYHKTKYMSPSLMQLTDHILNLSSNSKLL